MHTTQQQYAIQRHSTRLGGDGGEKTGGGQVMGGGAFVRARRFQNVDPMPVYGKCKKAVEMVSNENMLLIKPIKHPGAATISPPELLLPLATHTHLYLTSITTWPVLTSD